MKNMTVAHNHRYAICTTGYTEPIDRKDCVVRAIANALNLQYEVSFELLKKHGRKDGEGTYLFTTHKALKEFDNVTIFGAFGSRAIGTLDSIGVSKKDVKIYKGCSVKTFARAVRKGTYILLTTHHALVVRDGEIIGNKYEQLGAHIGLVYQVH